MSFEKLKAQTERYYTCKFKQHGPTPQGVDWKDRTSQRIRFDQLLKVVRRPDEPFSLNDFGCGYGALFDYLAELALPCRYIGYDLSTEMIDHASKRFDGTTTPELHCAFVNSDGMQPGDYTVASGVFNVKLSASQDEWLAYILETVDHIDRNSTKGYSFNMLTMYSDKEFMRDDLYYGDPSFFFAYCMTHHSRNVALLHDYELYEFTIVVRKENARPPVQANRT